MELQQQAMVRKVGKVAFKKSCPKKIRKTRCKLVLKLQCVYIYYTYLWIYIYIDGCTCMYKLDHLSLFNLFMLLMIHICRPDLLNCFSPPRKKSVQVEMVAFGKVHHLQLCSLNNSPQIPSQQSQESADRWDAISKRRMQRIEDMHGKLAVSWSEVVVLCGISIDIQLQNGPLGLYFVSRPWKQYELKQTSSLVKFCCDLSCFMLLTLTESWQSGFARWVFFLLNSPGEMICDYSTSRSVLAIVY